MCKPSQHKKKNKNLIKQKFNDEDVLVQNNAAYDWYLEN